MNGSAYAEFNGAQPQYDLPDLRGKRGKLIGAANCVGRVPDSRCCAVGAGFRVQRFRGSPAAPSSVAVLLRRTGAKASVFAKASPR